jgi:hypothetical protein
MTTTATTATTAAPNVSKYQQQGEAFLTAHGLEFRSVLVGADCPRFCEDAQAGKDMDKLNTFPRRAHIHGKHYRCTISGKDRGHVAYDFWNSYADEEHNYFRTHDKPQDNSFTDRMRRSKQPARTPTAYDLLACIEKNEPGTFKDFCDNFGYSDDSMRAFDVYRVVQEEYSKTRRFFTSSELEELQEIQ